MTFNGTCFNYFRFDLYSAFFFHLEMSHPVFVLLFYFVNTGSDVASVCVCACVEMLLAAVFA